MRVFLSFAKPDADLAAELEDGFSAEVRATLSRDSEWSGLSPFRVEQGKHREDRVGSGRGTHDRARPMFLVTISRAPARLPRRRWQRCHYRHWARVSARESWSSHCRPERFQTAR